jgi:hypothetical protein
VNMDIAAVPTPVRERRPAGERDRDSRVADVGRRDFPFRVDELVALDDLIPERQGIWIDGERSLDVREPLGLEPHIALLGFGCEFLRVSDGNDALTLGVGQANSRGYRKA